MTTALDRENTLLKEVEEVRAIYKLNGLTQPIRMFAEDYDFVKKRGSLHKFGSVVRGDRKKRRKAKRPPESIL